MSTSLADYLQRSQLIRRPLSHNPRSTVGTITEIYDYLRLLFARVGRPHCPNCGTEIKRSSADEIVSSILEKIELRPEFGSGVRLMIMSPIVRDRKGSLQRSLITSVKKDIAGYGLTVSSTGLMKILSSSKNNKHNVHVILDRLVIDKKIMRDETELKELK